MAVRKYTQFGRFIEVRVKNFNTRLLTTIPNDFKITFQFYKTIDEVNEASVGEIKIYGLTQATFNEIKEVNNEVMLYCGYSYAHIHLLFIANVVSVNRTYEGGSIVTTLKVSANFSSFNFGNLSISNEAQPMAKTMIELAEAVGRKAELNLWNVPSQHKASVTEYIKTKLVSFYASFSINYDIKVFCETFQLRAVNIVEQDGTSSSLAFSILDSAVDWYVDQSYKPYMRDVSSVGRFANLFVSDAGNVKEDKIAFRLNSDTGMLGYPQVEIKLEKVPENWKVRGNEEITLKGQQTILDSQQKKKEAERKAAEAAEKRRVKEAEAKAQGKEIKPLKQKAPKAKKQTMIQISRKFVKVKALLNPIVRPQSHVVLESTLFDYNGVYRVRNATYSGSNMDGDFTMELYLEDSTDQHATIATAQEIAQMGNREDEVSGDINDVTEVGEENAN